MNYIGKGYHKTEELLGKRTRHNMNEGMELEPGLNEVDDVERRPLKKSRISCHYGSECTRTDCSYEHRCRYGSLCERGSCKFDHSTAGMLIYVDYVDIF